MSDLTLKIRWTRHEDKVPDEPASYVNADIDVDPDLVTARITSLEDETTLFIPADQVRVHGFIPAGERVQVMKHWHAMSDGPGYMNYISTTTVISDDGKVGEDREQAGRLICVIKDHEETWYTASHAWVLGPDGGTIERVAP